MVIEVVCGVILDGDKVLCVQRSKTMSLSLKWEFPGGKIEKNETPEQCLYREIKEELGVAIEILEKLTNSYYDYGSFEIILIPYLCKYLGDEIILSEHKEFQWLLFSELTMLEWAPADVPIVKEIIKLNANNKGRFI
ncbi:MAG: (deoxy)nucleoside triphosphate pyrophosphohydrolase [Saprospiraceae bacterium]|jgi:8-oxo-dGTP diphosphatase|nr:(deoxy)nucleoside triphosphate pyrophosphohydrolase [Saprospiraceae bacterium]MBP6565769.1 (deoxy)nucleoside triphosphate pyrophosphohydrolase [Saprospiraceae bacterium]